MSDDLMELRDYLTGPSLAAALGVTRNWVNNMNSQGSGPKYHREGQRCIYMITDVRDWIEARAVKGNYRSQTAQRERFYKLFPHMKPEESE